MKKIFLLLFLTSKILLSQTVDVLFIGNSYTYANNMPQMVSEIASSFGDTLNFESSTPGGATFNFHSTNINTLNKISQKPWDYVVLQAQSQEPSFSPIQVQMMFSHMLKFLLILLHLILTVRSQYFL